MDSVKIDISDVVRSQVNTFRDSVCAHFAAQAEYYSKDNAKWQDQTGDARRLLKGIVIDEPKSVGFRVMHRVSYGIHLEEANSGKYAILRPTANHLAPEFRRAARKFFEDE